jgi:DOMON domain
VGWGLLMFAHQPAIAGAAPRQVSAAGVNLRWQVLTGRAGEADGLYACVEAATTGWVAVGFSPRAELAGTRLVMVRVVGGRAHAEMHIADPPLHHHRRQADGTEWVREVTGQQVNGVTRVCFAMPLRTDAVGDTPVKPGQATHLVLAWSHEPDFNHHSAKRESLEITL